MREQLISFLTSKKAIAGIAGAIVALAARWGLELPADELAAVLSPIIIYIVAQGRADRGKTAAMLGASVYGDRGLRARLGMFASLQARLGENVILARPDTGAYGSMISSTSWTSTLTPKAQANCRSERSASTSRETVPGSMIRSNNSLSSRGF